MATAALRPNGVSRRWKIWTDKGECSMCLRACRKNHTDWSLFRPYRYAHRGLHDLSAGIPENTLPAFRRRLELGFARSWTST